jgi:hypothetical protein
MGACSGWLKTNIGVVSDASDNTSAWMDSDTGYIVLDTRMFWFGTLFGAGLADNRFEINPRTGDIYQVNTDSSTNLAQATAWGNIATEGDMRRQLQDLGHSVTGTSSSDPNAVSDGVTSLLEAISKTIDPTLPPPDSTDPFGDGDPYEIP